MTYQKPQVISLTLNEVEKANVNAFAQDTLGGHGGSCQCQCQCQCQGQ
jgi:hypothetical protein